MNTQIEITADGVTESQAYEQFLQFRTCSWSGGNDVYLEVPANRTIQDLTKELGHFLLTEEITPAFARSLLTQYLSHGRKQMQVDFLLWRRRDGDPPGGGHEIHALPGSPNEFTGPPCGCAFG
jgi:hypothetical protein